MINVRKKKMESYLVDVYIAYKNQSSTAPKIIFGLLDTRFSSRTDTEGMSNDMVFNKAIKL